MLQPQYQPHAHARVATNFKFRPPLAERVLVLPQIDVLNGYIPPGAAKVEYWISTVPAHSRGWLHMDTNLIALINTRYVG